MDFKKTMDKAIKICDAANVDIDHVASYLWTWEDGDDVVSQLFNEGLDKYPGPHTAEHKNSAYKFAAEYASKELDKVYSKLKSAVDKKLKSGYEKSKQNLNSLKKG